MLAPAKSWSTQPLRADDSRTAGQKRNGTARTFCFIRVGNILTGKRLRFARDERWCD